MLCLTKSLKCTRPYLNPMQYVLPHEAADWKALFHCRQLSAYNIKPVAVCSVMALA